MRWNWRTAAAARLAGKRNQARAGRRARLEPLEDRRLLSLAGVVGVPPLGGPEWITAATDEPAEAGPLPEIAFSGEAGILTAAPAAPDLLAESDSGVSNADNLTNLDNSAPEMRLQFSISNTIPGATVTLYADGVAIGSAVAEGPTTIITTNGSLDLADGLRSITARQTSPGEEESSDSAVLNVTIDTAAPAAPAAPDLQAASDTGISSTDNITSDNTPTFTASVPSGTYFRLYRDGSPVSGDYESGSTFTVQPQPDGTFSFAVAAADAAGNISAPSPALSVTVDTTIPSSPVLLAVSDTGVSNSDKLTNLDNSRPERTLQFSVGNTVPGAIVTLFSDGIVIGGTIADGTTTTLTTNGAYDLVDGVRAITARQTPPGGVESHDSAPVTVRIDTAAPGALDPGLSGRFDTSGSVQDVAISGTLAYVADGPAGLVILDVTNPAAPVQVGATLVGDYAYGVCVSGTLVYVAAANAGLVIIDVTNPAAPVRLGQCDTSGRANDVVVCGTRAYIADSAAGLQIVDVADPAVPVRVGGYDTNGVTYGVAVVGSLAYLADGPRGLQIIDVANPALPVRLGSYGLNGIAYGLAISEGVAYIADGYGGLQIINVANPAVPVPVSGYAMAANGVAVSGTLACVADELAGLVLLDVTAPNVPVPLGGYQTTGGTYGVTISGTTVYLADRAAGLAIIDPGQPLLPPAPDLIAASDTGISSTDNITSDNTPTFDLTVPAGFYYRVYRDGTQITGNYQTGASYTTGAQANGSYTYSVALVDHAGNVSVASAGLLVTIDTSIPSPPDLVSDTGVSIIDHLTNLDNSTSDKTLQFRVGNTIAGATVTLYADGTPIGSAVAKLATTFVTSNGSYDLADGAHAITARQTVPGGPESPESAVLLVTIDTIVPTPVSPVGLGQYDTSGCANAVVVSGTLAYVADDSAGLQIIDIANPEVPVRLGGYTTSGPAADVTLSGNLVYVAEYTAGVEILDVTNPAEPVLVGGYDSPGAAYAVAVAGTLAYVADHHAGLQILDVTNPAEPVLVGGYDTAGKAWDVVLSGSLAYVADHDAGLVILDVTNPANPVRVGGYDTSGIAYRVAISGNLAYVADNDAGLLILDVTNPAVPVRMGGWNVSAYAYAYDVAVSGGVAYLAYSSYGLTMLDVSNPIDPVWLGRFDTGRFAYGVALSGERAYVADRNTGLNILDLGEAASATLPLLDLQPASDTGISNADKITGDTTPTFSVPVPVGSYFRVYCDGVRISNSFESAIFGSPGYTPTVQADGTHDYSFAIADKAGNLSPQSPPLAVTIDTTIPTVKNVLVGGSGWTGEFLAELNAANGQNVGGYSIPVGTGAQLSPLAWGNIDQIKIVFSEGVVVDKDDLLLSGVNTPSYDLAGATFSYDPASFTATWKLASSLAADKLEIRLNADAAGFVQDPIARRLDGEWTNPTSPADTGADTYPSGNGTAGGDFVFRFRALPCDANQDGAVDIFDVAKLQVNYGQTSGMMPGDGDFDGNGTVDIFDVALLQVAYGSTLEPPAPMPAGAPGAAGAPVASRTGHSPAESSQIAESLGGRVSGPPEEPSQIRHGVSCHTGHLTQSVRSTVRRSVETVKARGSRVSLFPRTLAVHRAVETAAWASAVDDVLEKA